MRFTISANLSIFYYSFHTYLYHSDSDSSMAPSIPEEYRNLLDKDYIPSDNESESKTDFILTLEENENENEDENEVENNESVSNTVTINRKSRAVRNERKRKRNFGEEYTMESGKIRKGRKCQTLRQCRMKCIDKFSDEDRNMIFKEYWGSGSHEKRVSFITALITKTKKACSKEKLADKKHKNKEFTYKYHLRINGEKFNICKTCFRRTLGETNKFLELCSIRINSSCSGIFENDQRGKKQPSNKYTEEDINQVRQFILSIPLYESHYTRRDIKKSTYCHITL